MLDDAFIKNSKQFSLVDEKWIWLGDLAQEGSEGEDTITREIDKFQEVEGDVQVTQQEDPSSQRKRARSEGTSRGA